MRLSESQLTLAHDAWESTASSWHVVKLSDGSAVLRHTPMFIVDPAAPLSISSNEQIAYIHFADEATAHFALREKIIEAIAEAIQFRSGDQPTKNVNAPDPNVNNVNKET